MILEAALERSRSERAAERFAAIPQLGISDDPRALQRLVELLADEAVGEWHYSPIHDENVDQLVCDEAMHVLQQRLALAWPALVAALPAATTAGTRIRSLLRMLPAADRIALPDEAHAVIAAHAATAGSAFERELARRHREGELDREAVWQIWLRDHPDARSAAIPPLVAAGEPASVAQQLVELLDDPAVGYGCACALRDLLPALDERWLRAIAESPWPARYPILLPALAKYGEIAAAILPVCVECFEPKSALKIAKSARLQLGKEALLAFGPLAERVRPRLVEIFLTVDEMPSLSDPSTRWPLVELLGKARLAAELGDIDALPEPDWYANRRKAEIKKLLS